MNWTQLLSPTEIDAGVRAAGQRIVIDYGLREPGAEIVLVGLLQGGLFFLADLARAIGGPARIATMLPQSYGDGRASSGQVDLARDLSVDIRERHVLVVEDIYDSGRTLRTVCDRLAARGPRSLEVACLIVKDAPRAATVAVRYGLFTVPNVFVAGCGLDFAGLGRNLPGLWAMPRGLTEQAALQQLRAQLCGGFETD
ncbi:MAG TPA: phosphoribosyltransferase family protein [Terriglobales bacterium]|nr:phosphoribosyltransferase family protein [Terriglobales bacterium]